MKKDNRKVFFIMVLIIGLVMIGQGKKQISFGVCTSYQCSDYSGDWWIYKDPDKLESESNSCCTATSSSQVSSCNDYGYTSLYSDCSGGSCDCSSGSCCDGCYFLPVGSQPNGVTDDFVCEGTNSPTGTSYVKKIDYSCTGSSSNPTSTQDTWDTCGTCEYCNDGDSSCDDYSQGTSCGTNMQCDGNGNCISSNQCTDSDGGKNYTIQGIVTYNSQLFTDYCTENVGYAGNWSVKEYFCSNNQKSEEVKDCKEVFGMYGCLDGRCVECITDIDCVAKYEDGYTCNYNICQLTGNTCADYPNNYGSCALSGGSTCTADKTAILSDCIDLDSTNNYVYCWTQKTSCSNECIITNLQARCNLICTDSDGGKIYDVRGTTTSDGTTKKDECKLDGYFIKERYCESDGTIGTEEYDCRNLEGGGSCEFGLEGAMCKGATICDNICGEWTNNICGGGDCEATKMHQIRDSACPTTCIKSRCVNNSNCITSGCDVSTCGPWSNSTYQCGTRTCSDPDCTDLYISKSCGTGTTDSWMKYLWIFFGFMGFMMFMKMISRMNK